MGGIRGLLMMTCGQQRNCKMNYIDISSHSQAIRFHPYILELVCLPFDQYISSQISYDLIRKKIVCDSDFHYVNDPVYLLFLCTHSSLLT